MYFFFIFCVQKIKFASYLRKYFPKPKLVRKQNIVIHERARYNSFWLKMNDENCEENRVWARPSLCWWCIVEGCNTHTDVVFTKTWTDQNRPEPSRNRAGTDQNPAGTDQNPAWTDHKPAWTDHKPAGPTKVISAGALLNFRSFRGGGIYWRGAVIGEGRLLPKLLPTTTLF